MQLAILEFAEKFVFENKLNITPSQLCKLLDAVEEKFTSTNTRMDEIALLESSVRFIEKVPCSIETQTAIMQINAVVAQLRHA